jgi:AcrR family transcriptional regulator
METTAQPKTARGEATRKAILDAAEKVIGSVGFNEASISGITQAAGVAQGTFYIYFKSKDEVFRALVLDMGRRLRRALSEATEHVGDRIEAEKRGLAAFLTFVAAQPDLYRIVQEALFVDPGAYRAYFQTFADNYRDAIAVAAGAGQMRPGDAEIRAWVLMGIAKSLGERYAVWGETRPIEEMVAAAHDLIVHGLRP